MLLRLRGIGDIGNFSSTSIQNSHTNFNLIQVCSGVLGVSDQHRSGFGGGAA